MGKAFTLHDLSFALNNLGIITFGSQGSQGNQGNQGEQGEQGNQGEQTPQYINKGTAYAVPFIL